MAIDRGLLAILEAKPGKGDDLAAFLEQGRALAADEEGTVTWYAFRLSDTTYGIFDPFADEEGTVTWYAFRLSDTTYGIFDTFADEDGRQAHLNGRIPEALGQVADDLLASDPDIRMSDILAVK